MHLVTFENIHEARDALRDIIYMYFNMTEHQNGFFYATDTGTFDPFIYLDAENDPTSEDLMPPQDINLLHTGSAIALLCNIYDIWNENENLHLSYADRIYDAVASGRFRHLPDIEILLKEVFERNLSWEDLWLHEVLPLIYKKYVFGFFERLSQTIH